MTLSNLILITNRWHCGKDCYNSYNRQWHDENNPRRGRVPCLQLHIWNILMQGWKLRAVKPIAFFFFFPSRSVYSLPSHQSCSAYACSLAKFHLKRNSEHRQMTGYSVLEFAKHFPSHRQSHFFLRTTLKIRQGRCVNLCFTNEGTEIHVFWLC